MHGIPSKPFNAEILPPLRNDDGLSPESFFGFDAFNNRARVWGNTIHNDVVIKAVVVEHLQGVLQKV